MTRRTIDLLPFDGRWDWPTCIFVLASTTIGTFLGTFLGSYFGYWFLSPFFALVLVLLGLLSSYMGAEFLRKKLDGPDDSDVDESQGEGAWIFLSHSSKDWPKCQRIRNMLEAKGHKPILFFLKCLEEETELDDLIKREIEARSWFLLCESENARRSKWVQEEVSYIKQFPDKYYETINLNSSVRTQIDRIDRLSKRLTVFVSSASKDRETYGKFKRSLKRRGYNVLDERELIAGNDNFASEMQQIVEQASVKGFVYF